MNVARDISGSRNQWYEPLVGSESSFEHRRLQIQELTGLELTSKTVERHAESIGADMARRQETEIQQAIQLNLAEVEIPDIPLIYVEMDGTGIPVVKSETEDRIGKIEGESARSSWAVYLRKPQRTIKADRFAMMTPPHTRGQSRQRLSSVGGPMLKRFVAVGTAPERKWSSPMAPPGFGISSPNTFRARFRLSISAMPVSTCGILAGSFSPRIAFNATMGETASEKAGCWQD